MSHTISEERQPTQLFGLIWPRKLLAIGWNILDTCTLAYSKLQEKEALALILF